MYLLLFTYPNRGETNIQMSYLPAHTLFWPVQYAHTVLGGFIFSERVVAK